MELFEEIIARLTLTVEKGMGTLSIVSESDPCRQSCGFGLNG